MKDRQCAFAIVCRQGRGLKQTHGAKVALPGYGWVWTEREGEAKKIQTVMLLRETCPQKQRKKKNHLHFKKLTLTPTLTWSKRE